MPSAAPIYSVHCIAKDRRSEYALQHEPLFGGSMGLRAASWLLLGLLLCRPGWADIYVYTDADGAVSLSNMPTDDRYTVLVAAVPQAVPAAPVDRAREPAPASARKARYDRVVEEVSRAYGLESALLHAVIAVESSYNPKAVSNKGAAGLMQLMPGTAKRYGVTDAFDPEQNVRGGANYLRDLLKLFDSDVSLALAAFNAGENAVMKHGNRIPPYRETLRYVPRVLDHYERLRAAAGPP
jgi:soluble lytic murein transglycosylase-like protein